jgi:selenocysteine lyase/cysteine desulfurase
LNHADVRARFPALASGFAYLENAGGSQVPDVVVEAIHRYMVSDFVQLGAGYPPRGRGVRCLVGFR